MCGIVGMAGDINGKDKQIFQDMLIFSQVRGPHSTGVAGVDRNGKNDLDLVRVLGRPGDLIDVDKRWDKAVHTQKKFVLGHNRFATVGKISVQTAHPYEFDNIVGCHNGTIPEHQLKKLKDPYTNYGTDSQAVLANIEKFGVDKVIPNLIGAWALVWYDWRDGSLNFLRNGDRTLYYTYSANRRTIYWASEKGFLELALTRNDQEYGDVFDVTVDNHIKWIIPSNWNHEFSKPVKKVVKGYEYKSPLVDAAENDNGGARFPGSQGVSRQSGASTGSGAQIIDLRSNKWKDLPPYTPVGKDLKPETKLPDFVGAKQLNDQFHVNADGQGYLTKGKVKQKHTFRGYHGEELSEKQFEDLTKCGCAWCDTVTLWGQPVRFVSKTEHICMICNGDDIVRQSVGLR